MPLTPEDVRNKRFTPVRLREGYDMGEVDQFLDEVEAELERLTQENDGLRSSGGTTSSTPQLSLQKDAGGSDAATAEPAAVTTVSQASGAAARLLELATRNADEVVAEANEQSDLILAEARTKAERLESEARATADGLENDSRARAQQLDTETDERRQQLFAQLERDRDSLVREVEQLRSFEREYRSRLKSYFANQLAQLEGDEEATASLPGSEAEQTPGGLRGLIAEDGAQQPQ